MASYVATMSEATHARMGEGDWQGTLAVLKSAEAHQVVDYYVVKSGKDYLIGPVGKKEPISALQVCADQLKYSVWLEVCSPLITSNDLMVMMSLAILLCCLVMLAGKWIRRLVGNGINAEMTHLNGIALVDLASKRTAETSRITEFATVQSHIFQLLGTLRSNTKQAERWSFFRRFAHDVRGPIDALEKAFLGHQEDRALAHLAEIKQIAEKFLGESAKEGAFFCDLKQTIIDWIKLAQASHHSVQFVFNVSSIATHYAYLSPVELRIILWNGFKNSLEAKAQGLIFTLSLVIHGNKISLRINDNGPGVDRETLIRMSHGTMISTKPLGHGLGLRGMRELVKDRHGDVFFFSERESGFTIEATFLLVERIVHLDDDKYIRSKWLGAAAHLGLTIHSYSSEDEMLPFKHSANDFYFVDVELGAGLNGLDVARRLAEAHCRYIFLSTSYAPGDLDIPPYISGVIGKEVPV